MPLKYEKLNAAVKNWGSSTRSLLQSTGRGMGIRHREDSPSKGESLSKIKDRYGNDRYGATNRVTFSSINRSLIYTIQGAGKGMGGRKGSRWYDKYGNAKRTKTASLGKAGTGGRQAKDFINTVIGGDEGVERLADIVAEHTGDAIVGEILVK